MFKNVKIVIEMKFVLSLIQYGFERLNIIIIFTRLRRSHNKG